MQRLIAGALLANGTSILHNISQSDDCTAALHLAAQLGAEIELGESSVRIRGTAGKPLPRGTEIQAGESGLAARLFTPIAGLHQGPLDVFSEKSLQRRPMAVFESVFEQLGGEAKAHNGAFPLKISKGIDGGMVHFDGSLSSQFVTGLLFALPAAKLDSLIRVDAPTSRPYIQLSLEILADFGIQLNAAEDFTKFSCAGNQTFRPIETVVDGDWSGAAALAVAGMLCAETSIQISGLENQYSQADEAIRGALLFAGGALSGTEDGIQVAQRPVRPFSLDLTDSPDLFPVLAALAAFGKKPSSMQGIHRLVHKESNRAAAIQTEWKKLGINVELDAVDDTMKVFPRATHFAPSSPVSSQGDHRIGMALTLIGLAGDVPIDIEGIESVAKSYPEFFDDLETLGAQFRIIQS